MKKVFFSHFLFLFPYFLFAQNIGIGTTTPQSKLHILSVTDEIVRLDANQPYIALYSNGIYKGYFWKSPNSIEIGSAGGSNLPVTIATEGFQRMFIAPSGNVGIGTSSPLQRLQVEGNAYVNGYVGIQNNNPTAPLSFPPFIGKKITLYPGATGDVGFSVAGNLLQIYADHPNADIAFGYDQSNVFIERMRIKGNGNVGIGTNNPVEKLEIAGNVKANTFKFSSAKTYYYSIPPTAFRAAWSADITGAGLTSISFNSVPTPAGGLIAPVYLPHGAVVTSFKVYYYDFSATTDLRFELLNHLQGSSGGFIMASVISAGAPGESNGIDNTISANNINNQFYDYSIEVSSTVGPWPTNMAVRSILITYTLTDVY